MPSQPLRLYQGDRVKRCNVKRYPQCKEVGHQSWGVPCLQHLHLTACGGLTHSLELQQLVLQVGLQHQGLRVFPLPPTAVHQGVEETGVQAIQLCQQHLEAAMMITTMMIMMIMMMIIKTSGRRRSDRRRRQGRCKRK